MKISHDRKSKKIWISQEKYIEKFLEKSIMQNTKPVSTLFAGYFKISSQQCPTTKEQKEEMNMTPNASVVGSLMYAMVYIKADIAHAIGVVSRFLSNPRKEH